MKGDLLVALTIIMAVTILSGCATPAITATRTPIVMSLPTALSATATPVITATHTPTVALLPAVSSATPVPASPNFGVNPSQATIPAGGALVITGGAISWDWRPGRDEPDWKDIEVIDGLAPRTSVYRLDSITPFRRKFAILTSCLTPTGTYTLTFEATGPGASQSAQMKLTIAPPVPDSPMGTFTTTDNIDVRPGSLTSMRIGLAARVTFCDTVPPRRLRITIQSFLSRASTPMRRQAGVRLFRALSTGAEREINTGTFRNAIEVPMANNSLPEWELSGGPYFIVLGERAGRYNTRNDPWPDDELPAQVTYTLEIVQ